MRDATAAAAVVSDRHGFGLSTTSRQVLQLASRDPTAGQGAQVARRECGGQHRPAAALGFKGAAQNHCTKPRRGMRAGNQSCVILLTPCVPRVPCHDGHNGIVRRRLGSRLTASVHIKVAQRVQQAVTGTYSQPPTSSIEKYERQAQQAGCEVPLFACAASRVAWHRRANALARLWLAS